MSIHAMGIGTIVELATGEEWGAERLRAEIERRARALHRMGVGPGSTVVIAHGGTAGFFSDLLAAHRLGACAACVNPALAAPELENVCGFLHPACVLVSGTGPAANVEAPIVDLAGESGTAPPVPAGTAGRLDDPALILFTSGTTGDPKGVVLTFRALLARVSLNRAFIGDAALARTLCVLPTHFGHGLIGNGLTPLLAGHTLLLGGGVGLATAAALGRTIEERRVTFLSSVPALWKLALKTSAPPPPGVLRRVSIGSAPLSADLWRSVVTWSGTDDVANMYGITETANWLAGASARDHEPEDGLLGTMWGGWFAVRDDAGRILPEGEGEILVMSPSVMAGYHRRDDLTALAIRDGWYHTGDVGRLGPDGVMRLTGRIKHEINRAGMKIHPEDVDLLLERHPDVIEACAFGIPDAASGEIVGVAVKLADGATADAPVLRAWAGERVRRESVPERWFLVEEIPKTDRGKINRDNVRTACLPEADA